MCKKAASSIAPRLLFLLEMESAGPGKAMSNEALANHGHPRVNWLVGDGRLDGGVCLVVPTVPRWDDDLAFQGTHEASATLHQFDVVRETHERLACFHLLPRTVLSTLLIFVSFASIAVVAEGNVPFSSVTHPALTPRIPGCRVSTTVTGVRNFALVRGSGFCHSPLRWFGPRPCCQQD